jgi:outer membrane murein-binding lipoprotein Lpp
MMRILGISAVALSAAVLAGCENLGNRQTFEGKYFRAKTSKVDKQRDVFVVNVKGVSQSEAGARQAAYHTGVSYCLKNFGASNIVWAQDPLDEEQPLRVADDQIDIQGRCPQAQ